MYLLSAAAILSCVVVASCGPAQHPLPANSRYFDIQGHRGSRGEAVESTLPAFAWGLIDGVTTLELDNGITKDGVVIVWHDEEITPDKCIDTAPVVKDDPDFPYVGKSIAQLTLDQIKTLDCGSLRLANYPLQLTYPRTKISTLREVFEFVDCVDPMHQILWNIESKVNPVHPNKTRGVKDFVEKQHKEFITSPYPLSQITYQSFDWRTLIAMKALESRIATSALIDVSTATTADNSTSPWLAGLRLDEFSGSSLGVRIANAASFIGAQILSPAAVDDTRPEYVLFTTREMVRRAHQAGMSVKPWTVNSISIAEDLMGSEGVDGIISDYPSNMRRFIKQRGLSVAPKFPKKRVYECLDQHVQRT